MTFAAGSETEAVPDIRHFAVKEFERHEGFSGCSLLARITLLPSPRAEARLAPSSGTGSRARGSRISLPSHARQFPRAGDRHGRIAGIEGPGRIPLAADQRIGRGELLVDDLPQKFSAFTPPSVLILS